MTTVCRLDRIVRLGCLLALFGALGSVAIAQAGTYEIKACGDGPQTDAWSVSGSPYVAAYSSCPSGNNEGGLLARNSGGPGSAPGFSAGQTVFTAPAGTSVVRLRGSVRVNADRGWQAGIRDYTNGAWVFCGPGTCTTFGTYQPFDIGGFSAPQIGGLVICGASSCARDALYGYIALKNLTITISDNGAPGLNIGGSLVDGGWINGTRAVNVDASDSTGIKAIRLLVDDVPREAPFRDCDYFRAAPCPNGGGTLALNTGDGIGDGQHKVTVQAIDSAGNVTGVDRTVSIDNHAPGQVQELAVEGGEAWRSTNRFDVSWVSPQQSGVAPIAAAEYELCPTGTASGDRNCRRGNRPAGEFTQLRPPAATDSAQPVKQRSAIRDLSVPGAGSWTLRLWLRDEAGNQDPNTAVPAALRFDDQPPALAFRALDPADPTRLVVRASDAPSGLARGFVEVQRRGEGTWRPLEAQLEKDGFAVTLDDENLPDGVYALRARAVDQAGNERSTEVFEDGEAAELALPVRIKTRLAVGKTKRVRVRRQGSKRRYRTKLIIKPRVNYGRKIRLAGRLTTPGQNPLAGTEVQVYEQIQAPGAAFRQIGTVTTSKTGRFSYKVATGPSRIIRFRYGGTKTIRARNGDVALSVRAATSFRASRRGVVNGQPVTFRGRLKGGHIPAGGKLLALQVYARGSWRPFATTRARADGRWSYTYRFDGTRGSVRYRFRVRVLREATYPFSTGTSRRTRVTVRGS